MQNLFGIERTSLCHFVNIVFRIDYCYIVHIDVTVTFYGKFEFLKKSHRAKSVAYGLWLQVVFGPRDRTGTNDNQVVCY